MSPGTAFSLVSVATASFALTLSIVVSKRQLKQGRDANVLPVIIEAFRETRSPGFADSVVYILENLSREHLPDDGYRHLPDPARSHVRLIGLYLDDLGKLVAHNIVDQELIIGAYGDLVDRVYRVMEPFMLAEEALDRSTPMPYFEDLAARVRDTSRAAVHKKLGLRQRTRQPPRRRLRLRLVKTPRSISPEQRGRNAIRQTKQVRANNPCCVTYPLRHNSFRFATSATPPSETQRRPRRAGPHSSSFAPLWENLTQPAADSLDWPLMSK